MIPRKDRVVELLLAGKSYKEIIAETGAAKGTISYHASRLGNPNRRKLSPEALRAKEMILALKGNPEIKASTGLSATRICELRRELSISSASAMGSTDWSAFQALYDTGISIRACCKQFDIALGSVSYAVKQGWFVGRPREPSPWDQVAVENSTYQRGTLKKRLLVEGLIKNECAICGIGPEWNGRPLSLHLDHKNGINNDNRLDNLRLLCPNCHSQTETFAGRNVRKR